MGKGRGPEREKKDGLCPFNLSSAFPAAGSTSAFKSSPQGEGTSEVGPHAREGCALEYIWSSKKYRHLDPTPDLSSGLSGCGGSIFRFFKSSLVDFEVQPKWRMLGEKTGT